MTSPMILPGAWPGHVPALYQQPFGYAQQPVVYQPQVQSPMVLSGPVASPVQYVMAPVPAPILPTSSYLTPGGVDMQNPFAYQSGMPVMATSGSFVAPVGTTSAPPPIGLPTGPAPTAPAPSTAPAPLPSAGSFVPPPTGPYVPPPLHPSTGSFVPQHYMPYAPMTSTGSFVPPLVPSGSFVPMPTSHSSSAVDGTWRHDGVVESVLRQLRQLHGAVLVRSPVLRRARQLRAGAVGRNRGFPTSGSFVAPAGPGVTVGLAKLSAPNRFKFYAKPPKSKEDHEQTGRGPSSGSDHRSASQPPQHSHKAGWLGGRPRRPRRGGRTGRTTPGPSKRSCGVHVVARASAR
eukprot:g9994.t1